MTDCCRRGASYPDTQLTRLGGPNCGQLSINRPRAELNDNLRDGMHQAQVHAGGAAHTLNRMGEGCSSPSDLKRVYVANP